MFLQNALDNNSDLDCEKNFLKKFCCNTCGKRFAQDFDLQNHLKEHKKQTQKCNFCGKKFKFNFEVNRHIKKCHELTQNNVKLLCKCKVCEVFVEKDEYNKHMKTHKNVTEKGTDFIVNLKLCKLNGVWKSEPNFIYKCNICTEKFQSEISLTEHMTKHKQNDDLKQSEDSLKNLLISRSNDMPQINDENKFECQKCNLKFDKKENLDLHITYCTKSSRNIWRKFLGAQNNLKTSFVCTVCGVNFDNLQLLNDHKTSRCKPPYFCTSSQTICETKELGLKPKDNCTTHTFPHVKVDKNIKFLENEAQSSVQCDSSLNLNKEKSQFSTLSLKKISDLLDSTANSNQSFLQAVPNNLIVNNCRLGDKRLKNSCSNISERKHSDIVGTVNDSEVSRQAVSYSLMENNCSENVEKEKTLCSSNHVERKFVSHDLTVNNCSSSIKKEKDLCTTDVVKNNLNQESLAKNYKTSLSDLHNMTASCSTNIKKEREVAESDYLDLIDTANRTSNVVVKQELAHLENNTVEYLERETIYFTIKKTTCNGKVFSNTNHCNYGQTLKSKVLCECKICEKSFTNLDTLALHMSDHQECSMHECVVCDETFETILLWTNHMAFHQQQVDLSLTETHVNSNGTESNATDASYSESTELQQRLTPLENKKNETYLKMKRDFKDSHSDVPNNLNIGAKKSKVFQLSHTLPYQTINSILKSYSCTYCNKTFSGQGPLTNHEKSHTNLSKNKLLPNVEVTLMRFDSAETQLEMPIENDMINSDSIHTTNSILKTFSCTYCERTFSGQGPLTNHEKSHTNSNKNKLLSPNVDVTVTRFDPAEPQLNMQIEDNIINSNADSIQPQLRKVQKKLTLGPKRILCDYCGKRFTKQCHLTNHMRFVHKKHPKHITAKPWEIKNLTENNVIGNINVSEQSFNSSPKTKSAKEHQKNSLVSVNADLNNVDVNSLDKLSYCTICKKQFAHIGALTSHMHIHSNCRPYECRYCNRTFNMKGPYTRHLGKHKRMNNVKNIQAQNLSQIKIEMIEGKSENKQQQELNEDFNNSELVDISLNKSTNCTTSMKKSRMWFACDVCVKKFSTPFQLILHRRLKHEDVTLYVCKICSKSYSVRHRWNRHLKSHYLRNDCITNLKNGLHTNNPKLVGNIIKNDQHPNQFKCGYCKKEYNLIYHWKRHFSLSKKCRRHCKRNVPEFTSVQAKKDYTKSNRFECSICKKTYSTDYNRKVHLTNVHHIEWGATNFSFSNKNVEMQEQPIKQKPNPVQQKLNIPNQKRHRKSYNTAFQCNLCGKFYSSANNLSRHFKLTHTKDNGTIKCKICGRIFKHKYSYREHCKSKHKFLLQADGLKLNAIKSSSSSSQQVFGVQNKNITAQYTKKYTKTQHAENKYKCNDCGQQFETNVILGQHIIKDHCVKNTLKRLEEVVNTASRSNNNNNNNSVKCMICFKAFSSFSYLSSHMLLHSGLKPFKCDICNTAFRFKSNLRMHKKKHSVLTVE